MRMKLTLAGVLGAAILALCGAPKQAAANAIVVTNLALVNTDKANGNVDIQFDLSWSNSWRSVWDEGGTSITNWDAVWVFVKYRQTGGEWQHILLSDTGHTPAAGCAIDVGSSGSGTNVGAFIYRSSNGYGTLSAPATRLRWNYAVAGLTTTNEIEVSVHAIEMVYVAEGEFKVGSGGSESGRLYEGGGGTSPFAITNAGPVECGDAVSKLWGSSQAGNNSMGGAGTISSNFPNGYAAFYCMKYDLTQGQYADFLNALTRDQQINRCVATTSSYYMSATAGGSATVQYRNTVQLTGDSGSPAPRVYSTITPDRACNWLSWADVAAFADWAGLRPMTELEFEKACRGPLVPVADEYAWGTSTIMGTAKTLSGAEDGTETVTTSAVLGGCHYGNVTISGGDGGTGPLRAGIFATNNADRVSAGASYWGIMELSGNLWKRPVTIGNATGRLFTGLHGNGVLTVGGEADVNAWPPNATAAGVGFRGGNWDLVATNARASDRGDAANVYAIRDRPYGGRVGRVAPSQ